MGELLGDAGQGAVTRVGTVLRAPKTAELIATHLRRQIVRGELKPGETLPSEVHLMEQFGVSRPTLREAFRILEAESLIGVRRGARGGAQVLEPDPMVAARHVGLLLQLQGTTIRDVYEARMVTEPVCARMLSARRTEQDIADLRAVLDHLREIVDAGFEAVPDMATWANASYRFHELIMQRCGNKTLAVQGAVLADIVDAHVRQSLERELEKNEDLRPRFRKTLRSFSRAITLIEAGDGDAVEKHWRKHMEGAATYLFPKGTVNTSVVDLFG
ncbi:DNA-binding FadR family transcriptional regulator [Nocardia kruczakiae]|uniref:DNA-binding FadR family transcriptional regulator n=1 Tax=Nocardia kruczakiae TaxID=261477 RepID=A0ABU1X9S2_9NOCA|nr:GntR family transcriptional regulator [Nocardia kruczakiae]MDR7167295.1 DNA-binding FadR family transcriptional regulator [Nocardia kruczakiae]